MQRRSTFYAWATSQDNPYWQQVRDYAHDKGNGVEAGRCHHCGGLLWGRWHTHHLNYRYLGRELESPEGRASVVALHPECHDQLHQSRNLSLADAWERLKRWKPL